MSVKWDILVCLTVSPFTLSFQNFSTQPPFSMRPFLILPQYDIVGHSGDSPEIPFVSHDAPPQNNKERLEILKQMHAHAQFCWTGDHTLEATALAIKRMAAQEADEHFVVILSDANLERYGIPAEDLGKILTSDSQVNAFAIFIESLGNQADR